MMEHANQVGVFLERRQKKWQQKISQDLLS